VSVRDAALLPTTTTTGHDWEGESEGDGELLGRPLSKRMTRYLEIAERGLTIEERLFQLQELNPMAAAAFEHYRMGNTTREIANQLSTSLRTAQRCLETARDFMAVVENPQTPGERLEWLQVHDPQAHSVWLLTSYGFRQDDMAERLGISVRTVGRAAARARDVMCTEPPS